MTVGGLAAKSPCLLGDTSSIGGFFPFHLIVFRGAIVVRSVLSPIAVFINILWVDDWTAINCINPSSKKSVLRINMHTYHYINDTKRMNQKD